MTFRDIQTRLDFTLVADAIKSVREGGSPLSNDEFEMAKGMVWTLAENFAARDVNNFDIEATELRFELVGIKDQIAPLVGYIDVCGTIKDDCTLKPFNDFRGKRIVIDWKTRRGELDTRWKERLVDSWQWRIYTYFYGADLMLYRGVNDEEESREIIIKVPDTNKVEVEEYLQGAFLMRRALTDANLEVWPRKMSSQTCEAYGRTCPFYDECRENTMPRQALPDRSMSYTQLENFFLCPERSRRLLLLEDEGDSESTRLGQAVHRGIEEVYKQIKES